MHPLPQLVEPYWRTSTVLPSFSPLTENIDVDTVIVGGGISGITTAYLLANAGVEVALIEADRLLNGTTGHTTAKVTAQHDLIYDELLHHLGVEKARMYYDACTEAMQWIKTTIQAQRIDCDWKEEEAYIYSTTDASLPKLINEWKAYEKLGIAGTIKETMPLSMPIRAALVMKHQAQFHPLKYLQKLVETILQKGGKIYEQTPAADVEQGKTLTAITRQHKRLTCRHLVVCSHFPFYDGGFYFSRMYAERSYVLAVQSDKQYPGGMYLSADEPKRSIRSVDTPNGELLLIGGESHKTGQGIPTIEHYEALRSFASEVFPVTSLPYRWSAQDLTTLDKIPYIGNMTAHSRNVYVATGYRKWGMTNGTVAGLLLSDFILGRDNRYSELYTPSRFYADPSIKHFIVQNADVAKHLVEGKIEVVVRTPDDLANGEGAVVLVNGKRAGAYKDENGMLSIVDTTCTHLGCEVEWNSGDRTWDCPCHGSRFSVHGDVIEGPAQQPLQKIE